MTDRFTPEFVDAFPARMEPGVLYISVEYNTSGHLCACGCGEKVVTPLSPAQWSFTYDGRDVTLRPSVGNWALPCRSHYYIERSRVRRARQYSEFEIEANRDRDRAALQRQHENVQAVEGPDHLDIEDVGVPSRRGRRWRRLLDRFLKSSR